MTRTSYIKEFAIVVVSAIAVQISMSRQLYWLAWIAYVPYFLVLFSSGKRRSFIAGLLFGSVIATLSFYWMIPGAVRFTGNSMIYGIVVFLISLVVLSLYFGLLNIIFKLLQLPDRFGKAPLLNALIAAACFTLAERLFASIFVTMPWFGFHSGMSLSSNIYFIQPAAVGGISALSFFVVLVNAIIAIILLNKKYKEFWVAALCFGIYFFWGYVEIEVLQPKPSPEKAAKIALINNNVDPSIRWNDSTGNVLVNRLFELNREAAKFHPDLVVWTESAVPWTYEPNDDFINEIANIYEGQNATQLLGINTAYQDRLIYNSVYCILPDSKVESRYDKRFLLSMIEEKKLGLLFPFLSGGGVEVKKGESMEPVHTPVGNAGVLICNESTVPSAANDLVRNGADFFVNISNDGWFSNSYLVDLHFYNARLRAVENRKPMIINSNRGYCGAIAANGEVLLKIKTDEPFVKLITMPLNAHHNINYSVPALFIVISVLIVLGTGYFKMKK